MPLSVKQVSIRTTVVRILPSAPKKGGERDLESAGLFNDDGSLRLTFGALKLVLSRERLSALLNTQLDNETRGRIERKLNLVNEQLRESAAAQNLDSDICSLLRIASG